MLEQLTLQVVVLPLEQLYVFLEKIHVIMHAAHLLLVPIQFLLELLLLLLESSFDILGLDIWPSACRPHVVNVDQYQFSELCQDLLVFRLL